MGATNEVVLRVPVSMRLPASTVQYVERYARENAMRKTDAFLHFIMAGIEGEQSGTNQDRLDSLESKLDAIARQLGIASSNEQQVDLVKRSVSDAASCFPAIRKAFLFGSFARGTFNENSDVDIRLEIDRDQPFNLRDLEHFCKMVEQHTGREVDVVTADDLKDAHFEAAIERDKVLVYER